MPSFSIPLTGLQADTKALNTIANNLANMNTTGYKEQTASFSDLFYQQIGSSGSGDPIQSGAGVKIGSITTDFTTGSISSTGSSTDVALDGSGFFVVNSGGTQELTRAGNFTLDSSGNLTTQSGANILGYPAVDGSIDTNAGLISINIPTGAIQQPQATTSMSITSNLDSSTDIGDSTTAQITVYDSLGTSHAATITFSKTAENTWDYSIALPTGDATGSTANTTGTLTFDSSGNLISPTSDVTGITFSGLSDGASDLNFTWTLTDESGNGTISQVDASSAVSATTQDGYASGTYSGFSIGSDGTVSVKYSNGESAVVGQLAIATVSNEQGLKKLGDGLYETTLASGQASIGIAGAGGRGTLEAESLEGSNVDVSTEFANLIVAQRAFQANSKAVTTFDTVTEQTINMIR